MESRRPDSAKSRQTQKTLDTSLNQSKFSETFSSYNTLQSQKKDQFLKYLQEKEKDPKFKKFNQGALPQIPQNAPKQQLNKINSKPFEKRNSKIASKPKAQQSSKFKQQPRQINNVNKPSNDLLSTKWTLNQPNNSNKKQNKQQFNASKSFAEKNKQKMNSINGVIKNAQNEEKKLQKKIEFKGFKINGANKTNNKNNQEQKQLQNQFIIEKKQALSPSIKQSCRNSIKPQKPLKTQQQIKRQLQLLQISQFINQVETRNIDYYPDLYEEFVELNGSRLPEDLEKININDFLIAPTERDYEKIQKQIKENQQKLLEHDDQMSGSQILLNSSSSSQLVNSSASQTSINLDNMIDGDSESQQNQEQNRQNQIFLSSISSKDLKERNLFLTQILKGRVTKQGIKKLQQMEKSQIKFRKLEQSAEEKEDDIESLEINMMKKKSNRLLDRNMIEASGQIYRDCDYLSEQNKQRLQKLLNDQMDSSPFEVSEWESFTIRRLDEGIRLYRKLLNSPTELNQEVIPEACLPKDPHLRKQAERKILKEKIDSINSRLHQIQSVVVDQAKIQSIIEQNKTNKISETTQNLINEREKQTEELEVKNKKVVLMLAKAEKQKAELQAVLHQMQQSYKNYQKECKQFEKLSIDEIIRKQKQELKDQKKIIDEIGKSIQEIQLGTNETIEKLHNELKNQIGILNQIENFATNNQPELEQFNSDQTIENLDAIFERKAREDPQVIELKKSLNDLK